MKTDLVVTGYIFNNDKVLLIHHRKLNLWLGVGGHIDENETYDDALIREIREEVGLEVEILNENDLGVEGNVKRELKIPFYANVHSVGDHDHCCLYYICKLKDDSSIIANQRELKDYKWFKKDEINQEKIPLDVQNQVISAFNLYEKLTK